MEVVVPSSAPAGASGQAPGGRWVVPLIVLVVGMFATVLDTTIVNVAIPAIQKDLGASSDDVEWIVTAYTLALGMVVPLCGWLGDRIGLSRLYAFALAGFAVTSALCGLAWDLPSLVAFRILQAIPGGVLPVISLTMLYRIVPPAKIGSAMGMYGLGVVVAPAIGPTLGGWLLEHTTWPAIFFINLPIGLLGAVAAMLVFPSIRPTTWPKFDFWGFITIAYGLFAILLASSEGQSWGWTGYRVLLLFVSGALSLALFVVIELEVETPLLDVRVFKSWSYTNSLLLIIVVSIGLNAVLFYLPQYMQEGQGLTALNAGLTLLPEAFALVIMMPIAGKLYDLIGARWPAVAGLLISAYGTYLLTDLTPATTRMEIMVWTSLRALGVALAMMPIMTAGLSALPPESTGAGSAWSNVGQRVAGSLGLAGLGALVSSQQNQLLSDRSALLPVGDTGSVPGLQQLVDQGVTGLYGLYQQLQVQVLASAYADVFLVATVLTAAVVLLALMLPSRTSPAVEQPPPANADVVATEFSESVEPTALDTVEPAVLDTVEPPARAAGENRAHVPVAAGAGRGDCGGRRPRPEMVAAGGPRSMSGWGVTTSTREARSGLDLRWVDADIKPQDDLFGHVNGTWLRNHEIPDDRAQDGAFRDLRDRAEEDVRAIIEEASAAGSRRIGDLYTSFMDVERIESAGVGPLRPLLAEVAEATDRAGLAAVLGRRQREGLTALFGASVSTDAKDSTRYLVHLSQSGLGLPDEAYYREDSYAEIRAAYVTHLTRLAELVGLPEPAELAVTVMELETALAAVSWDRVTNRDAEKTYTLMTLRELREHAPDFDWDSWLAGLGVPESALDEVVVRQPSFVADAARLWTERPLEQWRAWLAIRTASACADYLNEAVVEQDFDFYGRTLSGTPVLRERWKRGVGLVEGALGEEVGQLYVSRHFPATSKQRIATLVENLVEAYRQSIGELDWMGPATRERALAKLARFTPKVGYPDTWKDYSALEVRADDLLGNVRRAGIWSTEFELAKIGQPVDHGEWFMTPQTVNAYYHPRLNEIVFPAAILQPPFFDPEADDAANYGGIGAVIGHEIGHGFDDQGSKYDGDGNMKDWWDTADRVEFDRRSQALIAQYSALSPAGLPGHKVNGALTVGENIGDLGGLTIALKAYRIALDAEGVGEPPVLDGLTGLQRVFFGWAQVWRVATREAEAVRRLATDPHSPPDLRCNAVVTNLDTFHEAFGVGDSNALFTPPAERVRIW